MLLVDEIELHLNSVETFNLANILDDVFCGGGFEQLPENEQDYLQDIIELIKGR